MLTFLPQTVHYVLFMDPQIPLFNNFFIKNGSHDTIYTFKNYFATVISAISFQFQQNKSYPNRPLEIKVIRLYYCWKFSIGFGLVLFVYVLFFFPICGTIQTYDFITLSIYPCMYRSINLSIWTKLIQTYDFITLSIYPCMYRSINLSIWTKLR